MTKVFQGTVPLDSNVRMVNYMKQTDVYKKLLADTPEASENKRKLGMQVANTLDSGRDYTEAFWKDYISVAGELKNRELEWLIYATSFLSSVFEIVTVTGNDIPSYSQAKPTGVTITRMSGHGSAPSVVKMRSHDIYVPQFYAVSTPKVYQPRASILNGNIGEDPVVRRDVMYEFDQTIEDDMWTLLAAACGSFGSDVISYDTRLQNIPTSNDYDYSSEGGITKNLIKSILQAVANIPSWVAPGRSATIRNIMVPASQMWDIADWVSVVSTASGQSVSQDAADSLSPMPQEKIESGGPNIGQMFGQQLGIRPVNRLMGTSSANYEKYLWVFLDGPAGRLYLKPDEDINMRLTDRLPLWVGFMVYKVMAMEVPGPYKRNFMRVQFDS